MRGQGVRTKGLWGREGEGWRVMRGEGESDDGGRVRVMMGGG